MRGIKPQYVILHEFFKSYLLKGLPMIERRSGERLVRELPLVFSNSGEEHRGMSSDFSVTGLFIITREPFSPGTSLKIRLEVSEREKIHLSGVVARTIKTGEGSIKDGMGIKLNNAPFKYHQLIESMGR